MRIFMRFLDTKLINWFIIGTYSYFCLIILIEVIRRYAFGASSAWGEMTARYAFVYLTYVAASEAIRHSRHIRIDLIPNWLSPSKARWLSLYIDVFNLIPCMRHCLLFIRVDGNTVVSWNSDVRY